MKKIFILLATLLLISSIGALAEKDSLPQNADTQTVLSNVVKENGRLQVIQGQLCNEKGKPVQLAGMSTHGLNFCRFYKDTMKYLVRDWHITVIRAAVFPTADGYIGRPDLIKERLEFIVNEAIRYGVYVIIDWHVIDNRDPNVYRDEAKALLTEMAKKYGQYPNVMYEICNEPNRVSWKESIKPYAEFVIPDIRAVDPDSVIIVGTERWSHEVEIAADDPLPYPNLLYTLHFYAGTDGQYLRDIADRALAKGIGLFVTEWGTTNSSGAGMLYLEESQRWIDWMKAKKISWCNWNFSNSFEDAAALNMTTGMNGPWKDSQLSESGEWVKSKIREVNP